MFDIKTIFTNFWINILIFLIFLVFVSLFLYKNICKEQKEKIYKYLKYVPPIIFFLLGILIISFLLEQVEKTLFSSVIVIIKLLLYFIWTLLCLKIFKIKI